MLLGLVQQPKISLEKKKVNPVEFSFRIGSATNSFSIDEKKSILTNI
jgi:hypothetical protein